MKLRSLAGAAWPHCTILIYSWCLPGIKESTGWGWCSMLASMESYCTVSMMLRRPGSVARLLCSLLIHSIALYIVALSSREIAS